jgi:hypothetical protein
MGMNSFQRKVLILGVCITVLAGTYVLGLVFSPARVGRREAEAPLIAGFERQTHERVAEILISSGEGERKIVKEGDSWVLPGAAREYPASSSRVDAFLDFVAGLARTRIVTSNPDAWEEFEVNNDAPKRIQLLDESGQPLTEIIIGKTAVGGGNNYVRLGGSNEVLLANRSFDYYLNVQERFWAYLRIFPEDLEGPDIMRITTDSRLRFEDQSSEPARYTLVLGSGQPAVWELADPAGVELDSSKVDLLATNLADLEGSEFAHGLSAEESGLVDPSARILLSTEDGRDFRLSVGGDAGDDQYYVALENESYIYKVSQWRLKGILKSIEELERADSEEQEQ